MKITWRLKEREREGNQLGKQAANDHKQQHSHYYHLVPSSSQDRQTLCAFQISKGIQKKNRERKRLAGGLRAVMLLDIARKNRQRKGKKKKKKSEPEKEREMTYQTQPPI